MATIQKPVSFEIYGHLFGNLNREINYVIDNGSGSVDPNTQHIAKMPTFKDLSKGAISSFIDQVEGMDSEIERKLQVLRDTIKKVEAIADVKKLNETVEKFLDGVEPQDAVDALRAQGKALKAFQLFKVQPVLSAAVQAMPSEPQPNCCENNKTMLVAIATGIVATVLSSAVTYYASKQV